MIGNTVDILMVEDDPGDVELTKEAMEDSKLNINLNVVEDGVQALRYLQKKDEYSKVTSPDLILLDLNLPRKDGREVLSELREDPDLRFIPVVVLTTSEADEDIMKSYGLGANCYVTKPVGLDQFSRVIQSIESFWFTSVKLPR